MKPGYLIRAKVVAITEYGAYVKYLKYRGFVHVSELSIFYVKSVKDILEVGKSYVFKILEIDEKKRHLSLSYKQNNKIRGIKGPVPKFAIGFKTLKLNLEKMINYEKNKTD